MNISQLISSRNSWGPIYAVGPKKELRVKYDTGFVAYGSTCSWACFSWKKLNRTLSNEKILIYQQTKLNSN